MTLNELAAAIVAVEPDDLPELGRIHSGLKDLKDSKLIPPEAVRLAAEAFSTIERVILRECEDPAAACAAVGKLIGAIQSEIDSPGSTALTVPCAGPAPDSQSPAKSCAEAAKPAEAMVIDAGLLNDFVTESLDHLERAEAALLDLEANPDDAEHVNGIFRAFHTIKGTSGFLSLDRINKVAHKAETLLDRARKGEVRLEGARADLALDSVDVLKKLIESVRARVEGAEDEEPEGVDELLAHLDSPDSEIERGVEPLRLGDVLVAKNKADRADVERVAAEQTGEAIGKKLTRAGVATAKDVVDALRTQKQMTGKCAGESDATLRVGMKKLDKLIDMVGELVIAHSMVSQDSVVREANSQALSRKVGQVTKITRELHDLTLSMRMVPLKSTFQKMERLVRDLARKSGKDVRFETAGEDTEVDRNMVEAIGDPLVHMMRNSVDHGIEAPDDRVAAGKPRQGTVTLRAYHSAGSVMLEVSDDGHGIDPEKIFAKAVEKGLIDPNKELSKSEILDIIFLPGFSTAKTITDVSGRGVGMDVVRKNVESLRGRVEITSEKGLGSKFIVKLPLTLAIIDGMVLRVGAENYILPTLCISQALKPAPGAISTVVGKGEMVNLRSNLVPVFRLHRLFHVRGAVDDPSQGLLVIVEHEGRRCALLADALLGQQQVVIKSVGAALGEVQGVAGAAILGSGRVGLILDVAGLVKTAHEVEHDRGPASAPLGLEAQLVR